MKYFTDISSEVTTWCNHDPTPDPVVTIQYGALYNWYAASDARNITSSGWHIPTRQEFYDLMRFIDNDGLPLNNTAGIELKDVNYWDLPNLGTNSYGFNSRGAGLRGVSFASLLRLTFYHTVTEKTSDSTYVHAAVLYSSFFGSPLVNTMNIGDNDDDPNDVSLKYIGKSIRPFADSTTLSNGEEGTYTDPSGYTYRTICIGTQEIVADNIATKHYRNGDDIPIVTDQATWNALVTGAMCYYNNDSSYGIS